MAATTTGDMVDDFISRHEEWIEHNLPRCIYGTSRPDGDGGGFRLHLLFPVLLSCEEREKIEELRQLAAKEDIELDVRVAKGLRPCGCQ